MPHTLTPPPSRWRARRLASLAAAGATLLAGTMLAVAGPASAASVDNVSSLSAAYTLENESNGLVADNLNQSTSAGNPIGQWPSNGGSNQQWTIASGTGSDAGSYTIWNNQSGMCLNVSGGSTVQGAPVIQSPCNGQASQQWQINYTGGWDGTAPIATIVNVNSGLNLNSTKQAAGAGLVQGGPITSSSSNESAGAWSDQWSLTRSTGGIPGLITTGSSNYVVDDPGSSTAWGTPLDVWQPNGGTNQEWYLQAADDVWFVNGAGVESEATEYRIINGSSDECLEAEGNNPQAGDTIDEYGCDPNYVNQPNQLWLLYNVPTDSVGGITELITQGGANTELVNLATLPNAATLTQSEVASAPAVAESSTFDPADGSTLTLQPPSSPNRLWELYYINPAGSGSSSAASDTPCTRFACLTGF